MIRFSSTALGENSTTTLPWRIIKMQSDSARQV